MNAVISFQFDTTLIRVLSRQGEPWFVLADVCRVLELENPRNVTARLDDDEKGVHKMDTPGGPQEVTIINESGLYSLILTSRKPEAKRFRKWVTAEVLPRIRKTGRYGIPAIAQPPPSSRDCRRWTLWPALRSHLSDRHFHRLPMMRISHLTGLTLTAIEQAIHEFIEEGLVECRGERVAVVTGTLDPAVYDDLEATAMRLSSRSELAEVERLLRGIVHARFDSVSIRQLLVTIKATTRIPLTVLERQLRDLQRRLNGDSRDSRTFRLTGRTLSAPETMGPIWNYRTLCDDRNPS